MEDPLRLVLRSNAFSADVRTSTPAALALWPNLIRHHMAQGLGEFRRLPYHRKMVVRVVQRRPPGLPFLLFRHDRRAIDPPFLPVRDTPGSPVPCRPRLAAHRADTRVQEFLGFVLIRDCATPCRLGWRLVDDGHGHFVGKSLLFIPDQSLAKFPEPRWLRDQHRIAILECMFAPAPLDQCRNRSPATIFPQIDIRHTTFLGEFRHRSMCFPRGSTAFHLLPSFCVL